jgi:sporulation protein YlmC with PRC-barrel domain
MAGDPVSWLLIEPGWTVYDAAGEKVGKVKEVLADEEADIFHGVVVEHGLLGAEEEIVADRIAEIHDGDLHLS